MKRKYVYTGQEGLEVLEGAVNYSRYQYDFIVREINQTDKQKVKILDFGAGRGTYADMFKNKNWQVDCVEIDPQGAEILRSKGYKVFKSVEEISDKYDVIYALNVLEHIEDDAKALTTLRPLLSKDGVIVIYVPAFMLLFTKLDILVEHFRRYRIKDMRRLAIDAGLKLKEVRYCDPAGFAAALVYRLVRGSGELKPRSVGIFDKYFFPIGTFFEPLLKKILGKNVLAIYTNKKALVK